MNLRLNRRETMFLFIIPGETYRPYRRKLTYFFAEIKNPNEIDDALARYCGYLADQLIKLANELIKNEGSTDLVIQNQRQKSLVNDKYWFILGCLQTVAAACGDQATFKKIFFRYVGLPAGVHLIKAICSQETVEWLEMNHPELQRLIPKNLSIAALTELKEWIGDLSEGYPDYLKSKFKEAQQRILLLTRGYIHQQEQANNGVFSVPNSLINLIGLFSSPIKDVVEKTELSENAGLSNINRMIYCHNSV